MAKKVVIDFEARLAKFEESIKKASAKLDAFSSKAKARSADLSGAFSSIAGKLAGLFTIGVVARDFSEINRQMGNLEATLRVLTGSAEGADAVMRRMEVFVKDLPISVAEATEAFVRMKALGLNPTEDAIRSFGNTAAAMGKPLEQFIEAVADATTGEFERLKEFGIKTSQQAETVTFTFQGMSTTVKKNAEAIQQYLVDIGNTTFAGAMEEQAKTWDGAMKRMSKAWNNFLVSVSNTGVIDMAIDLVNTGASLMDRAAGRIKLAFGDGDDAAQIAEISDEIERLERVQAGLFAQSNEEQGFFSRFFGDPEAQLARVSKRLNELREMRQTLLSRPAPAASEGEGEIDTKKSVSALDKLRNALNATATAATRYKETIELLKEKEKDPFEKAETSAAKVATAYKLIGDALAAVRAGDVDAASDIESAASAINKLKEEGLVAEQTIKDMKRAIAEAVLPDKESESKIKIVPEIDDDELIKFTDEATRKAQEAAKANPIIIPVKPVLIDGSGSEFLENIPEFGGGYELDAEKYGSKR